MGPMTFQSGSHRCFRCRLGLVRLLALLHVTLNWFAGWLCYLALASGFQLHYLSRLCSEQSEQPTANGHLTSQRAAGNIAPYSLHRFWYSSQQGTDPMHSTSGSNRLPSFCPNIQCPADHFEVTALGPEEWSIDGKWHIAATNPCCVLCGTDLSMAATQELPAPMLEFLLSLT